MKIGIIGTQQFIKMGVVKSGKMEALEKVSIILIKH
jgi:hypothetical protein